MPLLQPFSIGADGSWLAAGRAAVAGGATYVGKGAGGMTDVGLGMGGTAYVCAKAGAAIVKIRRFVSAKKNNLTRANELSPELAYPSVFS